jgi:hypothetical protein
MAERQPSTLVPCRGMGCSGCCGRRTGDVDEVRDDLRGYVLDGLGDVTP